MVASAAAALAEAASETGYRLCRVPVAGGAADEEAETRLARPLPDGSGRVALADAAGGLLLLAAATQDVVGRFRVYLGSFEEEEVEAEEGPPPPPPPPPEGPPTARPQPCALPVTGLAFVPPRANGDETDCQSGQQQDVFLLLGETDTVMCATLPPPLPEDEEAGGAASASRRYAYGSPLLAMSPHKARVLSVAVDNTGSVLASGDAVGHLRVWKLVKGNGGGGVVGEAGGGDMVVDVAGAHEGPILALAHGEALPGEEGHIVTGGRDRAVRVWAWWVDEWGRLGVRPQHTLLTERCEVRCLGAGQGLGLVVGGTDRGALYCWSSLTSVLEYVAVSGEQPLTCVTALAEPDDEEGEASLVVTADVAGVVRLYRPTYLDPAKAPLAGEGEEEEEEEDSAWQPVAEARLDAPAVAAMVVGPLLVVVSSTGLVMPWPLASLPRYPGEERRAPPPTPSSPAAASESPASTEPYLREEEEEEYRPRCAPPPAPIATAEGAMAAAEAYLTGLRGAMETGEHPWVACELGAPAVNSTAAVRDALERARQADFDADAAEDAAETASVLAEAAQAVNVDPRYRVYRRLRDVGDVRLPAPRVVKRQVDPAWRAKQALRPTARDFFTPGLEGLVVAGGAVDAGTVPLWPREAQRRAVAAAGVGTVREGGGEGEPLDPYMAMYGTAV